MGFHVEVNTILRSDDPVLVVEQQDYQFRKQGSRVFFDGMPIWLARMDWTAVAEIVVTSQARTAKEIVGTYRVVHVYSESEQAVLSQVFRRMYSFSGEFDPFLYLLESAEVLESAVRAGCLIRDDLRKEGFIHASPLDQLTRVANKYYRGVRDLRCAVVAKNRVISEIKYEPATAGIYPHIYGPLNMDAIERIVEVKPGSNGTYDIDLSGC